MANTTSSKILKNIPISESGSSTTCNTSSREKYIITQCTEKQRFTLWKILESGFERLSTSNSPTKLYEMIPWDS